MSDEAIVVRRDDTVRVEAYDERLLGSIAVPSNTNGAPIAEIAGPGRLLLDFGDAVRVVDFGGKEITSFFSTVRVGLPARLEFEWQAGTI